MNTQYNLKEIKLHCWNGEIEESDGSLNIVELNNGKNTNKYYIDECENLYIKDEKFKQRNGYYPLINQSVLVYNNFTDAEKDIDNIDTFDILYIKENQEKEKI